MTKPNFLIVGSQKCGTTWLHVSLDRSEQIFGSKIKELNFFNKIDFHDRLDDYFANFPGDVDAEYFLESTPHYFQLPTGRLDIAQNIKDVLGSPKIMVIFRDPVERYQSAYIHHMMKGRFAYNEEIDEATDEYKLLTLGLYAEILDHWADIFPDIGIFFYDDIVADRFKFIGDTMRFLDLENDLTAEDVDFRTNDKQLKVRKLSDHWPVMPVISEKLRSQLNEYYSDDVTRLEEKTGRDLKHWLSGSR